MSMRLAIPRAGDPTRRRSFCILSVTLNRRVTASCSTRTGGERVMPPCAAWMAMRARDACPDEDSRTRVINNGQEHLPNMLSRQRNPALVAAGEVPEACKYIEYCAMKHDDVGRGRAHTLRGTWDLGLGCRHV